MAFVPNIPKFPEGSTPGAPRDITQTDNSDLDSIYTVNYDNWYKTLPYGFQFNPRPESVNLAKTMLIWLPIAPSNLSVTTQMATNIVSTLYGVVEEHSDVKFYNVSISGTTGHAPKYTNVQRLGVSNAPGFKSNGRGDLSKTYTDVVNLGGVFNAAQETINNALKKFNDIANKPKNISGIIPEISGYAAFQNMYRALLLYKKDTAGASGQGAQDRAIHPLQFLNYKDGVKYDCVIQSFRFVKSAANPHEYNYDIQMTCYNLRGVNETENETAVDLESLGLSTDFESTIESTSKFKELKDKVNSAKGFLDSVASSANIIGT
jgi:hypothetical protein